MTVTRATAPAKLNLSLQVRPKDASGLHPVRGLTQSIGWYDILTMEPADSDSLVVHGAHLPSGDENLVWKAVEALRERTGDHRWAAFRLWKRIPVAAGLAGGSSDAAAALLLYGRLIGAGRGRLDCPAALIGADVTFCLYGGLRWIHGYGEMLGSPIGESNGFWVVVAVPPFRLETRRIYEIWDLLGGPEGPRAAGHDLPPGIRGHGPLSNDLYPAAVWAAPVLDDWRAELVDRWDRPVLMSGSGPALFGFFANPEEATEALALVPVEARSTFAAETLDHGAVVTDDR